MLVGAEMMLGLGILVCVQKTFHFPATIYEHVFTVSVIGILHLNKKMAKNLQISLPVISASSPMVSHQ